MPHENGGEAMTAVASTIIRINARDVDLSLGTVGNGNGPPVALRPQALAVLKLLAAKPGALVSKDELMAAVWPGIAVTDDSLVQCVTEIRKALGDDAHKFVKTVPKRGYVFELGAREPAARKRPYLVAALAAVLAIALFAAYFARPDLGRAEFYRPGVAVLPFNNLSGDAQWDKLADGLTEDAITDLSRFPHLKVISRHSVEAYRSKVADMREAGKALGVQYVIEGSVQREGKVLRVTAQLIDAGTGGHVWAQRWDRTDTGNIALQDEVAASIAVETGGAFETGAIMQADAAKARAKAVEARSAYEHFVIGVAAKGRRTRESNAEGFDAINRALALDPEFALGYAARGWLHQFSTDYGADWNTAIAAMGADTKKAFDLDPNNAITIASYSFYFALVDRLKDADAMARQAVAINPYDSFVLCIAASVFPYSGHPDEALIFADRQRAIDPHAQPALVACPVDAYFYGRRFEAVAEIAAKVLPESRSAGFRFMYAASLAFLGRGPEAELAKATFLESRPGSTAQMYYTEGWYFAREQERKLFFDGFRALGIPMCATAEQLKLIAKPEPLPECPAGAG
jgi:TolB-like protein/DNA-binding winged helix-turn-helix (wHTH) protein